MASYALLIGIDAYGPASELDSAVSGVQFMAQWLTEQGLVAPEAIRRLCAPYTASEGEHPATRAAIRDALFDLQRRGAQAQTNDRLYLLFAGYGAGYFSDQLLLLPQDSTQDAYGDTAIPWAELMLWLRNTGFRTQFCFVAVAIAANEDLNDALLEAHLPVDSTDTVDQPDQVEQFVFLSSDTGPADECSAGPRWFFAALEAGLRGMAVASLDYVHNERVIHIEALHDYLAQASAEHNTKQQSVLTPLGTSNPIFARLGPALQGELQVEIQPPEAAALAKVAIYHDDGTNPLATSNGPSFSFNVIQHGRYLVVAQAPGHQRAVDYVQATTLPATTTLHMSHMSVLGHIPQIQAELLIEPGEPILPVRLHNSFGSPIPLGAKRTQGYIVKTPPDRYRAALVTPTRDIEHEIEALAGQRTLIRIPFQPSPELRTLDILLAAIDKGQLLDIRLPADKAALLVFARNIPDRSSVPLLAEEPSQVVAPAQLPPDVIPFLRHSHVGTPHTTWVTFYSIDNELFQLFVPLLPKHITIVGIDGGTAGMPVIELLIAPAPLRRLQLATQKQILWAQRFCCTNREKFASVLVQGLDDQPLALVIAGYNALMNGNRETAQRCAARIREIAPLLGDGTLLSAASTAAPQQALPATSFHGLLPLTRGGLQQMMSRLSLTSLHPLTLLIFQRAVLNQFWMVVRSSAGLSLNAERAAPEPFHDWIHHEAKAQAMPTQPQELPYPGDILLVTVTKVETEAVLNQWAKELQQPFTRHFAGDQTFLYLGMVSGAHTWLVQSEMGSGGQSGSFPTVSASIQALCPAAIIMVGIAFGIDPQKQRIGDILIARQLVAYELQRIGTDASDLPRIHFRGERAASSPRLLDRFRSGAIDWKGAPLDFGLVLSGDKLIDQRDFRDQLLSHEPEAVGGEMEGAGLYAAAQRQKVDWILVKAVCDYADGQKGQDKARRQNKAARNAARFVFHVLQQGGFTHRMEMQPGSSPTNSPVSATQPGKVPGPVLRRVLDRYFNASELQILCFDLGIEYENLGGASKSDKTSELVAYAERHNRTIDLEALVRTLRPKADWGAV